MPRSHSGPFLLAGQLHRDPAATAFELTFFLTGRLFIGISLIAIGVQHFHFAGFIGDLGLVPDWAPAHLFCGWLAGTILVVGGLSVLTGKYAQLITTVLGFVFLLSAFLRFGAHIPEMIHNVGVRGVFFELLACCAASWMLARLFAPSAAASGFSARLATVARWLFGISFVVFGSLHLQAPGWIAALIPHWIPFHFFFAWFTGCAMVAAGLSIATQIGSRPGATLLGLMLFSWVVMVHALRIAQALHSLDEWNSGFVCLMMAGSALIAAALAPSQSKAPGP